MLDHKSTLDVIVHLEKNIDLEKINYLGINVWPLVRLAIYQERHTDFPYSNKGSNTVVDYLKIFYMLIKCNFVHIINFVNKFQVKKKDLVFLSRYENYTVQFNGRSMDKHIDPIIKKLNDRFQYEKIEVFSQRTNKLNKVIQPYYLCGWQRKMSDFRISSLDQDLKVELINIKKKYYDLTKKELSLDWILYYIKITKDSSDYFFEMLREISPKVVFTTCYYSPANMGLIHACKRLGVLSVDIQHGQQGLYHPMYNEWINKTDKWNDLLPDKLWIWSDYDALNLVVDGNRYENIPRIIGGNQFVSLYLSQSKLFDDEESQEYLSVLKEYQRVILVVCSNEQSFNELIHENVLSLMKENNNWLWLVRLHPNSPIEYYSLMYEYLYQLGVVNFEMDFAKKCNFISLLINVDILITNNSSASIEALEIDVCRVVVHEYGEKLYKNLIDEGIIYYAETSDQIRVLINKSKKQSIYEINKLVDDDYKKLNNAMDDLLIPNETAIS